MFKRAIFIFTILCSPRVFAKCVPFVAENHGTKIDFAIPGDFVNICAKDKELCHRVTDGYPETVKTAGYFVLPEEWERYQTKIFTGFSDYLIAQFAESMKPEDFAEFKKYMKAQNGTIEDHTKLDESIKLKGEKNLGIVSESADSVTFGKVMRIKLANDVVNVFTVLNLVMKVKDRVLTLYVYQGLKNNDPSRTKNLAQTWAECIRKANVAKK